MLDFEISKSKDFSLLCGMDPFKSIAVPRPIAWISTVSKERGALPVRFPFTG